MNKTEWKANAIKYLLNAKSKHVYTDLAFTWKVVFTLFHMNKTE